MTTDPNLIEKYDREVYGQGEENFWTFDSTEEQEKILKVVDFAGKSVLEIGCGTGDMCRKMYDAGAELVIGIDPAPNAIARAIEKHGQNKQLFFQVSDAYDYPEIRAFDIVVMIGVLEHVSDPYDFLTTVMTRFTTFGSTIATSSPCFLNPRGYVWVALQTLLKIEMSLTDKHRIDPWWMDWFCTVKGKEIKNYPVDLSWGCGGRLIEDFERRLPKALPNVDNSAIQAFLVWMRRALLYERGQIGANMVYIIKI